MKLRIILLLFAITQFLLVKAQPEGGLYLSANPLAMLEPQAAYGLGVGYRFEDAFEISADLGIVRPNIFMGEGSYPNLKGIRIVTQYKFTISSNEYTLSKTFIGAELRIKKFDFDDQQSFTNIYTGRTIKDYKFLNTTTVSGFAGIIGKQWNLGETSPWAIEFYAGIGLKFRNIVRYDTPEDSFIVPKDVGFGETPNYADNYTSVYVPVGLRIMVRF